MDRERHRSGAPRAVSAGEWWMHRLFAVGAVWMIVTGSLLCDYAVILPSYPGAEKDK